MNDSNSTSSDSAAVQITHELLTRPLGPLDTAKETASFLDLAYQMADRPDHLLPRFVERAVEMAEGVAGGLCLLEGEGERLVLRHLTADLSMFEETRIARRESLFGTALEQNATVLARRPEIVHAWLADAGVPLPEVLIVPLYLEREKPTGTLWIVAPAENHFHGGHARALVELATFAALAMQTASRSEQLRRGLERQVLIVRELQHRANNHFAVTEALLRMSARHSRTIGEMQTNLSQCLHALARASALATTDIDWTSFPHASFDIRTILEAILAPYKAGEAVERRFTLRGPEIVCGYQALNGLGLLFHELAINALKHGALRDEGRIDIGWQKKEDEITLVWAEKSNIPVGQMPQRLGFGSHLLGMLVKQFGGDVKRDLSSSGMVIEMTLSASRLAA